MHITDNVEDDQPSPGPLAAVLPNNSGRFVHYSFIIHSCIAEIFD